METCCFGDKVLIFPRGIFVTTTTMILEGRLVGKEGRPRRFACKDGSSKSCIGKLSPPIGSEFSGLLKYDDVARFIKDLTPGTRSIYLQVDGDEPNLYLEHGYESPSIHLFAPGSF